MPKEHSASLCMVQAGQKINTEPLTKCRRSCIHGIPLAVAVPYVSRCKAYYVLPPYQYVQPRKKSENMRGGKKYEQLLKQIKNSRELSSLAYFGMVLHLSRFGRTGCEVFDLVVVVHHDG
jgi:hypothetical protein